jgi:hypothetical protein
MKLKNKMIRKHTSSGFFFITNAILCTENVLKFEMQKHGIEFLNLIRRNINFFFIVIFVLKSLFNFVFYER